MNDKIKEIEELYKEAASVTWFQNAIRDLLTRIKELEEGIETHRDYNLKSWAFDDLTFEDRDLYKLMEENVK